MKFSCAMTTGRIRKTNSKVCVSQLTLGTHHSAFSLLLLVSGWMGNGEDKYCQRIQQQRPFANRLSLMYSKVIETITIRYPHLDQFGFLGIHLWSDGCSRQFRSRFAFQLTTLFSSRVNVIRYYNECHHGKDFIDVIGGCIKNAAYRAVMAERLLHTPLDFTKSAKKLLKGIECVYLPEKVVMIELDEVKNAPHSTDMYFLKVRMAKRVFAKRAFQCLQLYQIISYKEPFHDQCYHRENGPEPCGHFNLPKTLHPNESCTKCFEGEIGGGWRQCTRHTQWYHKQCFYDWIWLFLFWFKILHRMDIIIFYLLEFPAVSLNWWVYSHFLNNDFDFNVLHVLVYFHSPSSVIFFLSENLEISKV